MVEATSTLSTEQTIETWRTPLTTIEPHRMATTSPVTRFGRALPPVCPLTHRYMSLMNLLLREARPDVASLLLYVRTTDFNRDFQLTFMRHSVGAAEDARSNALATQEMAQDVKRAGALA